MTRLITLWGRLRKGRIATTLVVLALAGVAVTHISTNVGTQPAGAQQHVALAAQAKGVASVTDTTVPADTVSNDSVVVVSNNTQSASGTTASAVTYSGNASTVTPSAPTVSSPPTYTPTTPSTPPSSGSGTTSNDQLPPPNIALPIRFPTQPIKPVPPVHPPINGCAPQAPPGFMSPDYCIRMD